MKKLSFSLILFFIFSSCNSLSEENQNIIDKIEEKYGCKISISFGKEKSGNSTPISFLLIKCTDLSTDIPSSLVSSDMAMTAYNSIKSENKYTHYRVNIGGKNYEFDLETLRLVKELYENNKQIILLLQGKNYHFIYERLSSEVKKEYSKEEFIDILKKQIVYSNHQYLNIGFEFINEQYKGETKKFIRFEGFYVVEKEKLLLKLVFSLDNDHILYGIKIDEIIPN